MSAAPEPPPAVSPPSRRVGRADGLDLRSLRLDEPPNRFIPHVPTTKQWAALLLQHVREVLYGGAGGGGKTDWLLMEAALYADEPDSAAIIFRNTLPNLTREPDGLIPRSHEWWRGTGARYSARDHTWYFPSGATVIFGYLHEPEAHRNYAGPSYRLIAYDEATEIRPASYTFMFSRLRRLMGQRIPLRVRAATNPGGRGHKFFRDRFHLTAGGPTREEIEGGRRAYLPAFIADNPYLDAAQYLEALAELDPITRAQIERGDWSADIVGEYFNRSWFPVDEARPIGAKMVRYWDLASSRDAKADRSAGALVARDESGIVWLVDLVYLRGGPDDVERAIRNTADRDGQAVPIVIEREPGASGGLLISSYQRRLLADRRVHPDPVSGSKMTRAAPLSGLASPPSHAVRLVRGAWNDVFLDEAESFPSGEHDDLVDALSGGYQWLVGKGPRPATVLRPTGPPVTVGR